MCPEKKNSVPDLRHAVAGKLLGFPPTGSLDPQSGFADSALPPRPKDQGS
jgi:hypothetical protein